MVPLLRKDQDAVYHEHRTEDKSKFGAVLGDVDEPLRAFPPLAAKCLPGQECVAFHDLVSTQSLSKMSMLPVFA